jgi:hypothetical protein
LDWSSIVGRPWTRNTLKAGSFAILRLERIISVANIYYLFHKVKGDRTCLPFTFEMLCLVASGRGSGLKTGPAGGSGPMNGRFPSAKGGSNGRAIRSPQRCFRHREKEWHWTPRLSPSRGFRFHRMGSIRTTATNLRVLLGAVGDSFSPPNCRHRCLGFNPGALLSRGKRNPGEIFLSSKSFKFIHDLVDKKDKFPGEVQI